MEIKGGDGGMTKKQYGAKSRALTHAQEVREALLHFEAEYRRNSRHRHQNFSRARRGHVLMSQLLRSFDLDVLKRKVTKFLRADTPEAHFRGYSITDFFRTTMRD